MYTGKQGTPRATSADSPARMNSPRRSSQLFLRNNSLQTSFAPFLVPAYTLFHRSSSMTALETLRAEFRPTLRLAIPLVFAELGWMSMAIVDTMMVGRLPNSATAIAAVSIGSILVHVLAAFGGGLLVGLDTLVSQAFGAGQREDCHRSLVHGIYLSLALTPLLMAPVWFFGSLLRYARISPDIIALAVPYSKAMAWGTLPLLLYFAVRRCMQGMNMVRPIAFALVTANLINAGGNWLLIYGRLGAPAMGAVGSGWSTAWARIYLSVVAVGSQN